MKTPSFLSCAKRNKGTGCGVLSRIGQVLSRGSAPNPLALVRWYWRGGGGVCNRLRPAGGLSMLLPILLACVRNHSTRSTAVGFISQQNRLTRKCTGQTLLIHHKRIRVSRGTLSVPPVQSHCQVLKQHNEGKSGTVRKAQS